MGKSPPTDDIKRRHTMSRIKSKNTSIELTLRKALWRSGVRYRKNYAKLPGVPDIAITKYQIAVFCDGDFWHGKDWEKKKTKIKSNRDYWIEKIERNMSRDRQNEWAVYCMGWMVIRFWGSEIQKQLSSCVNEIMCAIIQRKVESIDHLDDYYIEEQFYEN
jgi:DNA mismatch endonuclease (patch repair protein)